MKAFRTKEFKIVETETIQGTRTTRVPIHYDFQIVPRLDQGIDLALGKISRATYNKYYKEPEPEVPAAPEPEPPVEETATEDITEEKDGD